MRIFKDGMFTSGALPPLLLRIPAAFTYLGRTAFTLYDVAEVDRHHFAEAGPGGEVRRLIVLHFESFLPGSGQTFNYAIPTPPDDAWPDGRFSAEMVTFGGADYIHNTWFFSAAQNMRENPEAELVRTAALLEQKGLRLPGELQMSRYVRVVDEERRSELILFYMEPLADTGFQAADFVEGGSAEPHSKRLSSEITARSGALFAGGLN